MGKPQAAGNPKLNRHLQNKRKRSQIEDEEIAKIKEVLSTQAPARGSNPLAITQKSEIPTFAAARKFDDLPISQYTKSALKDAKYKSLTAIQRAAVPHALCGRDVLGAAKTGSGKTLAFVLPMVEQLYRSKWGALDGLGALIVSPTRELALQIFEELRKVGKNHEFSAGLLIGGKDVEEERSLVYNMNILVCTPGRLLQHMDETPGFDASSLQVLILDEADRILDMGFSATLNAIVANLPKERQTMLFSATQTKSVSALARLSLKDPEYVAVHAEADTPTPLRLQQAYMVCELHEKMDILWSFIKTHLKFKIIVFFSTCKQVKFAYEAFKRLRPGTPLRALHGRMAQFKRLAAFEQFNAAKGAVLFATDIAARGLDFPSVDWVIQADCPEDVAAYIHRVGRTARYTSAGKSLLLLTPNEKPGMLKLLEDAKVPVKMLKHNPAKMQPVTPALQALLSKDTELKEVAQRAVVSYLRATFLQPNKKVFDVSQLPIAEYALSMGLPTAPKLRFLKKQQKRKHDDDDDDDKNKKSKAQQQTADGVSEEEEDNTSSGDDDDDEEEELHKEGAKAINGKATNKNHNKNGSSDDDDDEEEQQDDDDDDDDLLVVKRRDIHNTLAELDAARAANPTTTTTIPITTNPNKKRKKLKINPNKTTGTRTVFDDQGHKVDPLSLLANDGTGGATGHSDDDDNGDYNNHDTHQHQLQNNTTDGLYAGVHNSVGERVAAARAVLAGRDKEDRAKLRDLKKTKRVEKRGRRLAREAQDLEANGAGVAVLGGSDGGSYSDDDDDNDSGVEYSDEEGGYSTDRTDNGTEYFSADSDEDEEERLGQRTGSGKKNKKKTPRSGRHKNEESDDGDSDIDMDLLESSDEDDIGYQNKKKRKVTSTSGTGKKKEKAHGMEVSHMDMALKSDVLKKKEKKKARGGGVPKSMSLADQEALALKLLRG